MYICIYVYMYICIYIYIYILERKQLCLKLNIIFELIMCFITFNFSRVRAFCFSDAYTSVEIGVI